MRISIFSLAIAGAMSAPCFAAGTAFVGPSGWSPTPSAVPADPAHPVMQWHMAGDTASSLTVAQTAVAYDDALGAIRTNFATNKIKPSVDKDMPCQGKTSHEIEFATGPDGHRIVINRLLVPASNGVVAVTYSREDGTPFDPDVAKAETAYCAATGT